MRLALLVPIALVLSGCAAPTTSLDPAAAPALAPLPTPIHDERDIIVGLGPYDVTGCAATRPCLDYPFTLERRALLRANASWGVDANAVALEVLTGSVRLLYAGPDAGERDVALQGALDAGDHVLRVHVYRMANDRYALDASFSEAPPAPLSGCDAARPGVAHAEGARPIADSPTRGAPIPCVHMPPAPTVEPTIGVHPESGVVFYYPTFPGGYGTDPAVARSVDQGASWEFVEPMLARENAHPTTLDPYLYLDPATGRLFVDDLLTPNCSMISWSDDEGASWEHSPLGGCAEFDHQTVFAGPPVTSPTLGYPNVVYRCAVNAVGTNSASTASTCQRSLDGGRLWLPPGEPAFTPRPLGRGNMGVPGWCDGLVGHGATGPDGAVYLPKGWCGEPWLAVSRDEGLTWTRTLVADNGFLRGDWGFLGHDAGIGVDADGNVYYGWVAADRMPYVAVSRDGGRSFEPPRMVAPPGVNEASHPELIAGGGGKIAFLYLGTTNSPGNFTSADCGADPFGCFDAPTSDYANTTWNAYVTLSLDADSAAPSYWTVTINDPADPVVRGECGELRCGAGHDFFDIRIGPDGSAWVAMGDSCIDACVHDPAAPGGNRALVGHVTGLDLSHAEGMTTAPSQAASISRAS